MNKPSYDLVPKLLITTHGKWTIPDNYLAGPETFKLPCNTRIMYASGMGIVNYLNQTVPNMIHKEYQKNKTNQYGLRQLKSFKKDLRAYDLYGCCDSLACKDNRRNNAPMLRGILESEKDTGMHYLDKMLITEFLDNSDELFRIASKVKGDDMPVKTFEISKSEFGKFDDGTKVRNIINLKDNRMILYIYGREPIDVLYNWDQTNDNNEPFATAKLRTTDSIEITLEAVLKRVEKIMKNLGIDLINLDIIDLSCNVTLNKRNEIAPINGNERSEYINKLTLLIFGNDEISSSSVLSSQLSQSSSNTNVLGLFSMLSSMWNNVTNNITNNTTKKNKRKVKKKVQPEPKSRRSYVRY